MTTKNRNEIHEKYVKILFDFLASQNEDLGMIASNSFNFPVVSEDGEEGNVEIIVKVPKEDEYIEKRESYKINEEKKKRAAIEAEKKKQAKIAKDEANRRKKEEKERERKENAGE